MNNAYRNVEEWYGPIRTVTITKRSPLGSVSFPFSSLNAKPFAIRVVFSACAKTIKSLHWVFLTKSADPLFLLRFFRFFSLFPFPLQAIELLLVQLWLIDLFLPLVPLRQSIYWYKKDFLQIVQRQLTGAWSARVKYTSIAMNTARNRYGCEKMRSSSRSSAM